jgi:ABC-type transport system involved in cytochrome c biogenesis permease subunit
MMKRRTILIVLIGILLVSGGSAAAGVSESGAEAFGRLPIQHQGRLKPVDTFARDQLLTFYHRSTIKGRSASAWLADTLIDPDTAMNEPLFRIRNDDAVVALGLEPLKGNLYTYNALTASMQGMLEMLHDLYGKPPAERSLIENQMVDTYIKCLRFQELSRSLTALTPTMRIDDPQIAAAFDLQPGQATSYLHFMLRRDTTVALLAEYEAGQDAESPRGQALRRFAATLNSRLADRGFHGLPLLPPEEGEKWLSPWELMDSEKLSDRQLQNLGQLERCLAAIYGGDPTAVSQADAFGRLVAGDAAVDLELFYNRSSLFDRSLYCYIGGFLLLLAGQLVIPVWARRFSIVLLIAGAGLHTAGLFIRMLIMGRAPVSNLYESVVFVGLVAVVMGLIVELVRRDRIGLLTAATLGAAFHFLGLRYAAEGDTMGMLVAVLDSNFWLATHVVTITIGYGAAMVAALVGHILLVQLIARPAACEQAESLLQTARGTAVTALFFTTLGTILGGIWADQSWGRFWGWDPKENGALLIILWLLFVLHGRLAGMLGKAAYASTLGLTSITVVMAWFGVNLLSVGLHNYGFSQKNLIWITVITILEIIFATGGYFVAKSRRAGLAEA